MRNDPKPIALTLEIAGRGWGIVSLPTRADASVPVCSIAMRKTVSDSFVVWLTKEHRRSLRIQISYFPIIWRCDYRTSGFCSRKHWEFFLSILATLKWITRRHAQRRALRGRWTYWCKLETCKLTIDHSDTLSISRPIDCSLCCSRSASFFLCREELLFH